ncbi:MAG: transporter [Geobacteraceae bacterium]|nr:transporter [Geobacteraceae bacterium]
MRKLLGAICFSVLAFTTAVCPAADLRMQSGFTFDWWSDNRSNDARQIAVPVRVEGNAGDFSATLLTAHVDTRLNPEGRDSASLGAFVDTKLVTSYQIIDRLPIDIIIGLDFNLPTGKTNLSRRELNLIMDPDLIPIVNFGEGFNVNPTVTLAGQWGNWAAGLGFGYLWRGEYDYSAEIGVTDYSPGDIITINGEARYYVTPRLYSRLFAGHSWYGRDTVRGIDSYQEGGFTAAGAGVNYSPAEQWNIDISFRGIFREKSKFPSTTGAMDTEPYNIHGDEWVADVGVRYLVDEKTAVGSTFQGRWHSGNDYPEAASRHIGAREKYSLGVKAVRALTPHLEAGLDVRGFLKHDEKANFPQYQPERHFTGFSVALVLAGKF